MTRAEAILAPKILSVRPDGMAAITGASVGLAPVGTIPGDCLGATGCSVIRP